MRPSSAAYESKRLSELSVRGKRVLVGDEVHQRTFGIRLGPSADRVSQYKKKLPQVFYSGVGQVLYILVGI